MAKPAPAAVGPPATVVTGAFMHDLWKWSEDRLQDAIDLDHQTMFLSEELDRSLDYSQGTRVNEHTLFFRLNRTTIEGLHWSVGKAMESSSRLRAELQDKATVLGNIDCPFDGRGPSGQAASRAEPVADAMKDLEHPVFELTQSVGVLYDWYDQVGYADKGSKIWTLSKDEIERLGFLIADLHSRIEAHHRNYMAAYTAGGAA